jgi:hypothetical protein
MKFTAKDPAQVIAREIYWLLTVAAFHYPELHEALGTGKCGCCGASISLPATQVHVAVSVGGDPESVNFGLVCDDCIKLDQDEIARGQHFCSPPLPAAGTLLCWLAELGVLDRLLLVHRKLDRYLRRPLLAEIERWGVPDDAGLLVEKIPSGGYQKRLVPLPIPWRDGREFVLVGDALVGLPIPLAGDAR